MKKSNINITKSLPSYDEALKRVSGDQTTINNNQQNSNSINNNITNTKTSTLPNGFNTHKSNDSNRKYFLLIYFLLNCLFILDKRINIIKFI